MDNIKEQNKILCKEFPFLIPRNRLTDKIADDYDYEYTELDAMPEGWRIKFGLEMCKEIKNALMEDGGEELVNKYRIVQIKEKYGGLRWYDLFTTEKVHKIIGKYATISLTTCLICGKPAKYISRGWVSPYCEDCAENIAKRYHNSATIEDFFRNIDIITS